MILYVGFGLEKYSTILHRKKLTNLIIWEMHGISHQYPVAWENATKPIVWGRPGKLVIFFFFFHVGFLSRTFTNHRDAGEGGRYFINSSLPLPSASQTIRH